MKTTRTRPNALSLLAIVVAVVVSSIGTQAADRLDWVQAKKGDHATYVRTLQYLLRARGFKMKTDATFGAQTQQVVQQFQWAKRLKADGVVGGQTWKALIVPLKLGSKGDAVRAVQSTLNAAGFKSPVDGNFGKLTQAAVRSFQYDMFIKADGVVGPITWNAMLNEGQFMPAD